ncbi:acyltransferase [Actinoplanes sp. NPDC051411]|uniref:acyltransferase family protein n=1 Tax=Actinoplanes sp. NPDC051411 TaxID=3155522 RepID=UPI00343B49A1
MPSKTRLAWLDALRAIAALLVVYAHLSHYLLRSVRGVSAEWLNAGPAGVMLFFLVSGYIIPASLERHGDLRRFWAGRFRRLFPLYTVVALLVVALGVAGVVPLDPLLAAHPGPAAVAHATMLPFLLGGPLVTPVFWTLSFEMVFYLLVAALFAVRLHRGSGIAALVLAVAAVVTAPLTPRLLGVSPVVVAVLLVLGLAAVVSGRRLAVVPAAVGLGVLALTLVVLNQDPAHVWDGVLILAVMFTGTTVYRADHGQAGWWQAGLAGAVVAGALLINWFAELTSLHALIPRYCVRSVLTLTVFAGAFALAMALRRRPVPHWLAGLGRISYSLYLVHYTLILVLAPVLTWLGVHLHGVAELPAVAGYLALLTGLSWLTHRYVELPFSTRLPTQGWYRRRAAEPTLEA